MQKSNDQVWTAKTVEDSASPDAQVRSLTPAEAQPWCNFPVLVPQALPNRTSITKSLLRPESKPGRASGDAKHRSPWTVGNPSSYVMEISGDERALRIKQFLYDWAPAAADQPCLWGSKTVPAEIGSGYVVWLGKDYKGNRGASSRIFRTSCEVSVLSGSFSDAEIIALYKSLKAVSSDWLDVLGNQPFAALSYWSRFSCDLVDPPHGLFRFRRPQDASYVWTSDLAVATSWQMPIPPTPEGYHFDSAGLFGDPQSLGELETIFSGGTHRGREIRAITQWGANGRIRIPAKLENHPCERRETTVLGLDVHHAYVDNEFGPHEAVWVDEDRNITTHVLTSSGTGMTTEWFQDTIRNVADYL